MRNILALDLGTKTGWAYSFHGVILANTKNFTPKKKDHPGCRWLDFRGWLSRTIINNDIHVVYYEKVMSHSATRAAHCYGAYEAMLELICYSHSCELFPIGVGTIKKFATGSGRAKKPDMIKAARDAGFDPVDDNAADAIHLLRYAMEGED